jgi:GntR family transcriptional regulator
MQKLKHPPLYIVAKEEILKYIQTSELKAGSRLPAENELTKTLGISRGTLREAMRLLEEGGVIRRRQGIGTIICKHQNLINSTLDINEGVSEMIRGKGMQPGALNVTVEEIKASPHLSKQLRLEAGTPVISLTRIRTAERLPVAYTKDFIPKHFISEVFFDAVQTGSLYAYIEGTLGIELTNSMLRIEPLKAPAAIANMLGIRTGSLLMFLKQIDTNPDNLPILYSEEYFIADRFDFIIARRRKRRPQ